MTNRYSQKAVLVLAIIMAGCVHNTVTNLPPGVTAAQVNAWTTAVNQVKIISDSVHAAQGTVIQLNRSGQFPDGPAYKSAITALAEITKGGIAANQVLQTVPNNFGQPVATQVVSLATQILTQVAALTTSTSGVAKSALATLNTSIAAMQLAAKTMADLKGTP